VRILFITEQFPYPLDNGGNVRTFNILKGLAQAHEVTLLGTHTSDVPEGWQRAVGDLCRQVRLVRVPRQSHTRELVAVARSVMTRQPFLLLRHTAAAVHRELRALVELQSRPFDAVHFNHLDAALYNHHLPPGIIRVLDQHNVVTNQVATTLRAEGRLLHRGILRFELPKISSFETKACNGMAACLVCSEADEAALRTMGVTTRIVVVPNGADTDYFAPLATTPTNDREIVFVGALDYDPCEKGIWYFCTEILPLLRRQMPDLRLVVVGRNPSARLLSVAKADLNVVLTGRVEDVRPHVQRAGAFVVPLLSGSGTRLKIIEAMAMGVPVVSTTVGAEGIAGTDGVHFRIADTAVAFALAVQSILRDSEEAQRLRLAGRRLVKERYTWQAACHALLNAYAIPTVAAAEPAPA
jgi:glycosyltransferase involved in cell wall biosynthesis